MRVTELGFRRVNDRILTRGDTWIRRPGMDRTLSKRLVTAAVLIPIVVSVVLTAPTWVVALVFGAFVLVGAWEWTDLTGILGGGRWLYLGSVLTLTCFLFAGLRYDLAITVVLGLGLAWWAVATLWVMRYQQGRQRGILDRPVLAWTIGWLVLLPSWLAVVVLHAEPERGPRLVLLLLCVIWGADTGAYLAGRKFGRRKLASRVSPGKTWEGALGAALAGLAVSLIGGAQIGLTGGDLERFVVLCVLTVPVSIVGDLTESLCKREAGVKDSGSLMPGHGGVLDRIDSLTAAAPFFAVGWGLIGALA